MRPSLQATIASYNLIFFVIRQSCPQATWAFPREMEDENLIPASIALLLLKDFVIEELQGKTRIPLKKYYEPIDDANQKHFSRSLVLPVLPFAPLDEYSILFEAIGAL